MHFFPDDRKSVGESSKKTKDFEGMDREKIETHLKGILEEYLDSEDVQEACLCTNELQSKLPKTEDIGLHLFVVQGLNLGAEKRDKDRTLLTKLFVHLYETKLLSRTEFEDGFKDALEFADDAAIDCPKLYDYYASFFAKLVIIDAIDLAFLGTSATEPLKRESKERFVILVLKAIQKETPDKLVSFYKESGLKLSSFLQSSTSIETVLKGQDLNPLIGVAS